jgi:hypothetical protein
MKVNPTLSINKLIFREQNSILTIFADGFADADGRYFPDVTICLNKEEAKALQNFIGETYDKC